MIALYTHLRVPLDCYPLVTPLDTPIGANLCIKEGENVRLCAKALQRGMFIAFGKTHSHKLCAGKPVFERAGISLVGALA